MQVHRMELHRSDDIRSDDARILTIYVKAPSRFA